MTRTFINADTKSCASFQKSAVEKLKLINVPTKKDEHYSYFPLKKLLSSSFSVNDQSEYTFTSKPEGVVCETLTSAYSTYKLLIETHYKELVKEETDYFALLSLAYSKDSLFIYIPKDTKVEEPLDLEKVIACDKNYQGSFSNVLIFLGKGSSLCLRMKTVQSQNIEHMHSRLLSVHLEDGANLKIENDLSLLSDIWHFDALRAKLKREATLEYVSGSKGSLSIRQDLRVDLLDQRAHATLRGLQVLRNKKSAFNHICVNHLAENCESNQHFKQVVYDGGKGVFEGKIWVDSQAQQTNAYQLCNSLTMGDRASVFAKPNLEIFADDVKASHGATISKLKSDEIFYLLSRGLDKKEAEKFLITGFCREIADNFSRKDVKYLLIPNQEGSASVK